MFRRLILASVLALTFLSTLALPTKAEAGGYIIYVYRNGQWVAQHR